MEDKTVYRMEDGTVVKVANAKASYGEEKRWDGHNMVSVATGSQWNHETLHCSRKGRYWIEHTSQMQGSTDYATWVSNRDAAQWLLANDHELPEDLKPLEEEVSE